jgi:predicted kinase
VSTRVVLMCGLVGSGKTTYALGLEARGLVRLSVDEYIWRKYGIFGIDFDEPQWIGHQQEAEQFLRDRLVEHIRAGEDVVLDLSFWNRAMRDDYRQLIESAGGRWELHYMKVDPEILPARLATRRLRSDANAFPIEPEMLTRFIASFEHPTGEGEIVIESP